MFCLKLKVPQSLYIGLISALYQKQDVTAEQLSFTSCTETFHKPFIQNQSCCKPLKVV